MNTNDSVIQSDTNTNPSVPKKGESLIKRTPEEKAERERRRKELIQGMIEGIAEENRKHNS
jgi:hypothetical protein